LHLQVPDLGVSSPKTYHLGYTSRWAAGKTPTQAAEHFFQVCSQVIGIPGLDDHVIHVGFDVPMQLISKAHLDRALIGCSCVFQPEGHSFVSICLVWGDECGLDLIFLRERNLVIT
jgi:hypothetical protein